MKGYALRGVELDANELAGSAPGGCQDGDLSGAEDVATVAMAEPNELVGNEPEGYKLEALEADGEVGGGNDRFGNELVGMLGTKLVGLAFCGNEFCGKEEVGTGVRPACCGGPGG